MEVSRVTSGAPPSAVAHIFQRPTRTEHDEPQRVLNKPLFKYDMSFWLNFLADVVLDPVKSRKIKMKVTEGFGDFGDFGHGGDGPRWDPASYQTSNCDRKRICGCGESEHWFGSCSGPLRSSISIREYHISFRFCVNYIGFLFLIRLQTTFD